jgi:hypothetical protein
MATLFAFAALWCATEAAKGRTWQWPGEDVWFCAKHFGAPDKLRTVHLVKLLECYQDADGIAEKKGKSLLNAQTLLKTAAGCAAAAVWAGLV